MKFYLAYCLGLKDQPHNNKADKGNCSHKALELLALKKFAEQEGRATFSEDETGGEWSVATFTPDEAMDAAWKLYTTVRAPHWQWLPKDYKDCRKWMYAALETNDGMFSPLKRTIIKPEQRFDFAIEEDWAKFQFKNPFPDGPDFIEGQLSVKGTVDLVVAVDHNPNVIEYIDWKTGECKNWVTNKPKTYADFCKDPQLRIYYYALSRLYPEKTVLMSIFWLRDGGPFTLPYSEDDIPLTLEMLRRRFETVKDCNHPKRIRPDFKCNWCHFKKTTMGDQGLDTCNFIHSEIKSLGIDRVTGKYGDVKKLMNYGEGGGRAAKEE